MTVATQRQGYTKVPQDEDDTFNSHNTPINAADSQEEFTQVKKKKQNTKRRSLLASVEKFVLDRNIVPIIICVIIACSAFPFSLLHYFIPEMLQKQFLISDEDVGLYSGLVDFSDSIGSFLSSAFIGYLSDLYGKKWLLVISLSSSMIRLMFYAFTKNVWLLITIEFFYGIVNSTSVLVRALLVEFSSKDSRLKYFGYLTASYAISRSLSSLIGGTLVSFQNSLKVQNPFFIYSLLAAALTFTSLMFSLLIPSKRRGRKVDANRQSVFSLRFVANWYTEVKSATNRNTILLIMCRGMISFASATLVWTLIAFTPVQEFGLELSAFHVGLLFMVFGMISFSVQFFLFTTFAQKFGLRGTFILGGTIAIVQLLAFPFSPLPYWSAGFEKTSDSTFIVSLFITLEVLLYGTSEVIRPSLDTMIVNTSDLDKQGSVQGISRMSHVFSDAMGSMIVGWLYSYFTRIGSVFYVFVFSATFYLIPMFIVYLLPDTIEQHHRESNSDTPIFDASSFQLQQQPDLTIGI